MRYVIYSKVLVVYDKVWWKTNQNWIYYLMKILTLAVGLLLTTTCSRNSISTAVHSNSHRKSTQVQHFEKSRLIKTWHEIQHLDISKKCTFTFFTELATPVVMAVRMTVDRCERDNFFFAMNSTDIFISEKRVHGLYFVSLFY